MPIIAIIGIDGSGKTTQAKLLVQKLKESGVSAKYLRADYALVELLSRLKLPVERLLPSPRLRRAGYQTDSPQVRKKRNPLMGFFMGVAGFFYSWTSYFIVASYGLGGRTVVCDRYFYQFFYDLYGRTGSRRAARFFPKPSKAYFLDGSLDLFRNRMANPFDRGVSSDYYSEVRSLFCDLTSRYHFTKVDASQSTSAISELILQDCYREVVRLTRSEA